MRRSVAVVALVVGATVGYSATIAFTGSPGVDPSPIPQPVAADRTTATTSPPPSATVTSRAVDQPLTGDEIYLVWSTGGLPAELTKALTERFDVVSVVKGDVAELTAGDDSVIPLDAIAVDALTHAAFHPEGWLNELEAGTVILGETSAVLRDASVGDVIGIGGHDFSVIAVVPDGAVAAAEVVFSQTDAASPVVTDRYALVATDLTRREFETEVRALYDGPAPLRIRTPSETPWLRHGDAVTPQVLIKNALGEFSYTNRRGADFDQDPRFQAEWIITADVPIVGTVECHRTVVDMLVGAMEELIEEGLAHLVDPSGYAGCWNPRFTRTLTGDSAGLSRHAWGAAVDLNASANPHGTAGSQDPRLVEIMQAWGFTWGGDWLVPDPMHFEYSQPPP